MSKIKEIENVKNNNLVSKHNNLIEAKYRLTLQEQRLMAIMVSDIKPSDKDFKSYKYKVKDFIKWVGIQGKDYYRELRKITAKLLTRIITIKENDKLIQTSWLSSATYDYNKGTIELCFDPHLKPYLLQLKNCFTQYALKNVLELKSKYAFRIYELCKQYQSIGKRKFHIEELRNILMIEKGELRQWNDFKRYVIEISLREINSKTDIKVSYKVEKIARKVEYIIFTIRNNPNYEQIKLTFEEQYRYDDLLRMIPTKYRKLETVKNTVIKYLKKKGFEYVKRNIEYANEKAEKNYRAFLIKAIKNDWALGWKEDLELLEKMNIKEEQSKSSKSEIKIEIKREKQIEDEIKQIEKERKVWDKLSKEQKEKYIQEVIKENPSFAQFGLKKIIIDFAIMKAYQDYSNKSK